MKKCTLFITLIFVLSVFSGCASERGQGAAVGAGGGAVIGGLIGYAIGGESGAKLGAVLGGAAGAAGGYAYGNHVAGQKEKYAKEEDWMNACIAQAQNANKEIIAYNRELGQQIANVQREASEIRTQKINAKTREGKLKEQKNMIDQMIAASNGRLEAGKKELKAQQYAVDEAKKNSKSDFAVCLNGEVEGLKANIAKLEQQTKDLASLSASMSV